MQTNLVMVVSANGAINRTTPGPLDWTSREDLRFFKTFTKQCGAVVMGRRTYATIGKPLVDRYNVVMTRHVERFSGGEQLLFTDQGPAGILELLAARGFSRIAIIGGSEINALFLKAGLIDYIYLSIEPVIIAGRAGLFAEVPRDCRLVLEAVDNLTASTLKLKYRVLKTDAAADEPCDRV